MTSYFRQGEVGRTTLLRVAYTLVVLAVVGGIAALISALISLDVMGGGFETTPGETLRANRPEALFNATGWAHLALLAALTVGIRTFHRRTLRSVLAGSRIRWRRWGTALGTAFGTVFLLWGVARVSGWLGPTPLTLTLGGAVLATVVQGLSVEGLRGYLAQSFATRTGSWTIRGHRVAPWLVGGALLLPPLLAVSVLLDSDIPTPASPALTASLIALYLLGAGLLPAVLLIATEGIEWPVAVQVVMRSGIGLAAVGGVAAPGISAGVLAVVVLVGSGIVARRAGITGPATLIDRLRNAVCAQGTGTPDETEEPSRACRNCGTPLMGRYCHLCGQRRRTEEPSIRLLVERFFDNVLEVDSRIVRTLRLLFFAPGALSAHYFAGRRADFIPPIRLYLVSSFAFFLLFAAFVPNLTRLGSTDDVDVQVHRSTVDSLYARQIPVDSLLPRAQFIGDAATDSLPGAGTEEADSARVSADDLEDDRPAALDDSIEVEEVYGDSLVVLDVKGLMEETIDAERRRRGRMEVERTTIVVPRSAVDSLSNGTLPVDSLAQRRVEMPDVADDSSRANGDVLPPAGETVGEDGSEGTAGWMDAALPKDANIERVLGDSLVVLSMPASYGNSAPAQTTGADAEEGDENEAFRTLLENAAKVMFLLVPIFALILSLIYLHEPYAHHVIFTLHVHSFAFAIVSLDFALELADLGATIMIPTRIFIYGGVFVYLIAAMKRAYGGGWLRTTFIAFVVANLYFIAGTVVFGTAVGLLENAGDSLPMGVF
jgi:hypothetical protein